MKALFNFPKIILVLAVACFVMPSANAQILKKLKKKAERAIERKLERKTEKETNKVMDSILDPNEKTPSKDGSKGETSTKNDPSTSSRTNGASDDTMSDANVLQDLQIYSKYDFVPGDKVLFFDDFSQDFVGDFPSKWNTNGSGEVVKISEVDGNWFELKPSNSIYYIPNIKILPEDYTIEFDLLTTGLGQSTSSAARMSVVLSDNDVFNSGSNHYVKASLPFGQYGVFDIKLYNYFNHRHASIDSRVKADIRDAFLNQPHIAISVTKNRFRLWVNETKYVDIPQFITELNVLNHLKFQLNDLKLGEERVFIRNLKVAEGGVDLRRKLLSEGKISTNGILFNSGSANIKPQSLGIVKQISQVLIQDNNMKLNIVGHTDSDGTDEANLQLSKDRAEAVKNALVTIYNIPADRLQTDGKGESVPVADNNSIDGKSQNRRVEFIKI